MLAHECTVSLPHRGELADLPTHVEGDEAQMALVNRLADRNWRAGNGGPFAAIVVDHITGELLSVGVNVVLSTHISSGHAEVTALGLAQASLGTWDLGAERGITVTQDVCKDDALAVFRAFRASDAVVYNPCGAATGGDSTN